MRQQGKHVWTKCPAPGCNVRFYSLVCENRKFCSVECARSNHVVKTKWHWEKNVKEDQMEEEEKGEHRKTIFTAGERGEGKFNAEPYSEGDVL